MGFVPPRPQDLADPVADIVRELSAVGKNLDFLRGVQPQQPSRHRDCANGSFEVAWRHVDNQTGTFFADLLNPITDEPDIRLIAQLLSIILMAKHHANKKFKVPQR